MYRKCLIPISSSIIFLVVSVMGTCRAKKSCMQSSMGPADLYNNGVMNPQYMWYRSRNKIQVPVVIDPNYTYKERRIILGGLYEIQYKTCIEFYIFNNTRVLNGYDFVYITKAKKGCWSHIGRVGGGAQELSLGKGCVNHRTAVHEMIHALGFAHEHVRSDRDKYVYIFWQNIMPGRESNFAKRNTKSTDPYGPYDYASIMHYDRRAFSHNRQDTIKPFKRGARIGVGKTMSQWDVKKLLRMYNCGRQGLFNLRGRLPFFGNTPKWSPSTYDTVPQFDNYLNDFEDDEEEGDEDHSPDEDDENLDIAPHHHPVDSGHDEYSLGHHRQPLTSRQHHPVHIGHEHEYSPGHHHHPPSQHHPVNDHENEYSLHHRHHHQPLTSPQHRPVNTGHENEYSVTRHHHQPLTSPHPVNLVHENDYSLGRHHRTLTFPEESPLSGQQRPSFYHYNYPALFSPSQETRNKKPFFSSFFNFG